METEVELKIQEKLEQKVEIQIQGEIDEGNHGANAIKKRWYFNTTQHRREQVRQDAIGLEKIKQDRIGWDGVG